MNIQITSLFLEKHSLAVPEGLSELLSNGDNWGARDEVNTDYHRTIKKEDGKIVTILRKRS